MYIITIHVSDFANQDDSAYEESDNSVTDDESDEEVEFPGRLTLYM